MNENWSINAEVSSRRTFTDYIDDVSTTYRANGDLTGAFAEEVSDRSEERFGIPGKQRGTSKDVDRFNFYGIAITYTIQDIKCPKILKGNF